MSLATNVSDALTRVATEIKSVRTLINGNQADLSALTTTAKSNLVAAINELVAASQSATGIDDTTTGTDSTWSSSKIASAIIALINDGAPSTTTVWSSQHTSDSIQAAVTNLVNGAPTALDTLKELADAIASDESSIGSILTGLDNRLRFDAAQTLTTTQQAQGQANLSVPSSASVGDTTTDFVAVFQAGLV
jgi:hypothetical protein